VSTLPRAARFRATVTEETTPFAVTIFYDSLAAGRLAKKAADVLTRELAREHEVEVSLWRLDFLQVEHTREQLSADLEAADLVIIASAEAEAGPNPIAASLASFLPVGAPLPHILFLDTRDLLMLDLPESARCKRPPLRTAGKRPQWLLQSCS